MTSHHCSKCGIKMDYPDWAEDDLRINLWCDMCRHKLWSYWKPRDLS